MEPNRSYRDAPATVKNCRIQIDKEGEWFINGSPITNRNIYLYFNRHVVRDDQGAYWLQTREQRCPLEVEDTPYIVKHVHIIRDIDLKIKVMLNDGETEFIPWNWVWVNRDSQIYCLVKQGGLEARFNRDSQFELGWALQYDPACSRFYLEGNPGKHYLAVRETYGDQEPTMVRKEDL